MKNKNQLQNPNLLRSFFSRPDSSAIIAVVLLVMTFSIFSDSFLTGENAFGLMRNGALYIFVGIGQAMALVVGDMNISLGAAGALATVTFGVCCQEFGMGILPATIFTLLAGALTGFINSMIITKVRINSFVTTLATMFVYQGIANGISKGYPYTKLPEGITAIGRGSVGVVPYLFIMAVALLIIIALFFRYTVLGRQVLATGGNREAARLSGIRTERIQVLCNTISGVFAAIAAILWISRLGSATPATGSDWMLISNAVAIIGGTALAGGVYTSVGFLCSGIMYAIIKNGLIMLKVNAYFEQTFLGVVILLAVTLESVRTKYANSRK
ncbi:MAG: ABC transporter permease [Eubacteriales bacterium]|nr:ABC transporter permease [Eubacteriales bacterium]